LEPSKPPSSPGTRQVKPGGPRGTSQTRLVQPGPGRQPGGPRGTHPNPVVHLDQARHPGSFHRGTTQPVFTWTRPASSEFHVEPPTRLSTWTRQVSGVFFPPGTIQTPVFHVAPRQAAARVPPEPSTPSFTWNQAGRRPVFHLDPSNPSSPGPGQGPSGVCSPGPSNPLFFTV